MQCMCGHCGTCAVMHTGMHASSSIYSHGDSTLSGRMHANAPEYIYGSIFAHRLDINFHGEFTASLALQYCLGSCTPDKLKVSVSKIVVVNILLMLKIDFKKLTRIG